MSDSIGFGTGNKSFKDAQKANNNKYNENIYKQINNLKSELKEVNAEILKEKAARKAAKKIGGNAGKVAGGPIGGIITKHPVGVGVGVSGGLFGGKITGEKIYDYYDENISSDASLSFLERAKSSIESQIERLERQIR
jgi:hypothetical protein